MTRDERTRGGREKRISPTVAHSRYTSSDYLRDVSRVVQAWTEAGAEICVGSVRVLSDVVIDLNESIYRSGKGASTEGQQARDRERRQRNSDLSELIADFRESLESINRPFGRAINELARVLRRSYERLSTKDS